MGPFNWEPRSLRGDGKLKRCHCISSLACLHGSVPGSTGAIANWRPRSAGETVQHNTGCAGGFAWLSYVVPVAQRRHMQFHLFVTLALVWPLCPFWSRPHWQGRFPPTPATHHDVQNTQKAVLYCTAVLVMLVAFGHTDVRCRTKMGMRTCASRVDEEQVAPTFTMHSYTY